MARAISSRAIVFVAMMGALGNILSLFSIAIAPLVPSIPLGPTAVSISIDLSHLTTFIGSLFWGPAVGGLTGLIGGVAASYEFGFSKGNMVTGLAIPIGKAMTGIAAGVLFSLFGLQDKRRKLLTLLVPPCAYLPEAGFTVLLFVEVLPAVFGIPSSVFYPIVLAILLKAWLEMFLIGSVLTLLARNETFSAYVAEHATGRKAS